MALDMLKGTLLACMVCFSASLAQELTNPDFTDGFLTPQGDTIPFGWSNSRGAYNGGCSFHYDMVTYRSAPAAARIDAEDDTCAASWNGSVVDKDDFAGQRVGLTGWVKLDNVTGTGSPAQVALHSGCGCGGWQHKGWQAAFGGSGTQDWTQFEDYLTLPTIQECENEFSLRCITLTINLYFRSPTGSMWVDDLVMIGPGGSRISLMPEPLKAIQNISVLPHQVVFVRPVNYRVTILKPDGQVHSVRRGSGSVAPVFDRKPATGTYVVKVDSDVGRTVRRIVVQAR